MKSGLNVEPRDAEEWRRLDADLRSKVIDRLFARVNADSCVPFTQFNAALSLARTLLADLAYPRKRR